MSEESGQGQGSGQAQGAGGQQGTGQQGTGAGQGEEPFDKDREPFDKDRALATIRTQRESENQLKERLRQAEAKLKEHEDAKLSETEKLQTRLAEEERKSLALEQSLQENRIRAHIERAAVKAGFIDPEDAVLRVDRALLQFDDEGRPKGDTLEKALKALAEAKPHLVGGRPHGSGDGGARTTSPAGTDMNSEIRRMAGRPA